MQKRFVFSPVLAAISLCTLGLAACGSDDPSEPGAGGSASFDAATAEQTYATLCQTCHSTQGEGSASGPNLQGTDHDYAVYVVRHGRDDLGYLSPMGEYSEGQISSDDLDNVLNWLASPSNPTTGEDLYVRYCANCHGDDAKGGRSGKDLIDVVGSEIDEVLPTVRSGKGSDMAEAESFMPSFSTSVLSDAEVTAITDYIASL